MGLFARVPKHPGVAFLIGTVVLGVFVVLPALLQIYVYSPKGEEMPGLRSILLTFFVLLGCMGLWTTLDHNALWLSRCTGKKLTHGRAIVLLLISWGLFFLGFPVLLVPLYVGCIVFYMMGKCHCDDGSCNTYVNFQKND